MKTLSPREATLRNQFRQKLVDSSRNVFSEADLLQLAVELCLEQGFPGSLSERNFVRRIIQDVILKTIPLSATQESRKSGSTIGVRGKLGVPGLSSEGGELHAPIFE
jgi:hypothetical protein